MASYPASGSTRAIQAVSLVVTVATDITRLGVGPVFMERTVDLGADN